MASAYFVVSNSLSTQISLDGGDFRDTVPAAGSLNIYSNKLIGNEDLCSQLATLVTAGSITVTRSGNTVTASDLTSFGYGADVISSRVDTDQNFVVDSAETTEVVNTTSVVFADSPLTVTSSMKTLLVDTSGGAVELDLPAAASSTGMSLLIKDVGGNCGTANITIDPNAAEEIDGSASSLVLDSDYCSFELFCNGTAWFSKIKDSDMAKSVYDTDGDGVVNKADNLEVTFSDITDVDSPHTITTETFLKCDSTGGAITVNLPAAASSSGRVITICDGTGQALNNAITVDADGAELINGAATIELQSAYDSVKLACDGTSWYTLDKRLAKPGTHTDLQTGGAADLTTTAFIAPGPGRVIAAFSKAGVAAPVDSGETMDCDVRIGGVSCLSSVMVVDETTTTDVVTGSIDTAANSFVAGDIITTVRDWTTGDGAPADALDNVIISFTYELF